MVRIFSCRSTLLKVYAGPKIARGGPDMSLDGAPAQTSQCDDFTLTYTTAMNAADTSTHSSWYQ